MRILGRNLWSMKTIFDKLILYLSDGRGTDDLRGHSSAHIHFQNAKCDLWIVPFYQHYWCLCSGLVRDRENPHHIVLIDDVKKRFWDHFLKKGLENFTGFFSRYIFLMFWIMSVANIILRDSSQIEQKTVMKLHFKRRHVSLIVTAEI